MTRRARAGWGRKGPRGSLGGSPPGGSPRTWPRSTASCWPATLHVASGRRTARDRVALRAKRRRPSGRVAEMRTLVTGAAGFIGSHLCRRLVAEGHDVVGLDDLSEGRLDNLSDSPEVALVEADVRDEGAVARAASGCDVLFHQAAKRSVPRSLLEPLLTTD